MGDGLARCDAELAKIDCQPGEFWLALMGAVDWMIERQLIEEDHIADAGKLESCYDDHVRASYSYRQNRA